MKTERDLTLPSQLGEGYRATFDRLCRMFRARGVPPSETADLAQETIARTLLHLSRRGLLCPRPSSDDHGRANLDGLRISVDGNGNGTATSSNGNGHALGPSLNGDRDGYHAPDDQPADPGIEPLIKRIAINLLIDRARAAAPTMLPIDGAEQLPEPGLDPGDEVARRQQREQVHHAINDLSTRHRTAMMLSLEGLTPAEIAAHLGIQRNAADALLYRARRSLAKHLSTLSGLIRGLAVLIALRLRGLTKRSEVARLSDATFVGQAAFGISVAALGAMLAWTIPAAPDAGAAVRTPRSTATTQTVHRISPAAEPPAGDTSTRDAPARTAVFAPTAEVDVRDHSVRTGARFENPASGEEEGLGLDLIHEREDERGLTGPMLDQATDTACQTTGSCEE